MYLLLSGEGPTDLGHGTGRGRISEGGAFQPGPLALIANQVLEALGAPMQLEQGLAGFVTKQTLETRAKQLRPLAKSPRLPGKKRGKETAYFFRNARALAAIANEKSRQAGSPVIAILFRDSDGTASAGRGLWEQKWQSMLDGFSAEQCPTGVPMLPKPKSEAWLICSLRPARRRSCEDLEDRSGNDASPNSLKAELSRIVGEPTTREKLCELIESGRIRAARIRMPSFDRFRDRLSKVIAQAD